MKYAVIYEKTATGYSAYAPDLPGCGASGRSFEEATRLIAEAIEGHIELLRERGEAVPTPTTLTGYVEAVA
ncbi:MAG TPA: type II toxin-antitoxin system HicB family antitoxin [Bryobacteraceae bacterium]|nr:type II toxin-antitoxin system HicB family antitoxin [Bryobacteraceae bacterium]